MNIWNYYIGDLITITDVNDHQHTGTIICMLGADEVDANEDFISIDTGEKQIGFYLQDIKGLEMAQKMAAAV